MLLSCVYLSDVCLSVGPSVTSQCSTETAKRRITQTALLDSPGTHSLGDPVRISPKTLASENGSPWTVVRRCLRDPTFSSFVTDGRTDRWTQDDSRGL